MSAAGGDIRLHGARNELAEESSRHKTTGQLARRTLLLGVGCVLTLTVCLCLPTGVFTGWELTMSPAHLLDLFAASFGQLVGVLTGNNSGVFVLQVCTYVVAAAGGAALGVCGSVYQSALNNPLAAPKTLGVMGGGALGAFLYILFFQRLQPAMVSSGAVSNDQILAWYATLSPLEWVSLQYGKALCSVAGCLLVVAVVVGVAALVGRGRLSNITMVITGQVIAGGVSAVILFARRLFLAQGNDDLADEMAAIENYVMMDTYSPVEVAAICIPLALCLLIIWCMRNRLTALTLGDAEAQAMGVSVNRLRYAMVAVCTVMVGVAISFTGHVAFLGFISAHIARKYVGPDMRYLLPCSMFTGAIAIVLVHYLTSTGFPLAVEGSEGMLVSVIGACVFLGFALRDRGGSGDWR